MANAVPFMPERGKGLAYSDPSIGEVRTGAFKRSLSALRKEDVQQAGMDIAHGISRLGDYGNLRDNPTGYYIEIPESKKPEDASVVEWGDVDEDGVYGVYSSEESPPSLLGWVDTLSKFSDRPHSEEDIKRIAGVALYFAILGDRGE